ncbi:UNVERIFIED_CONTAM: Syntaxin-18 [Gekko kuhli]
MAVDITLLFKASVKTVKTRNKALGVPLGGGPDEPSPPLLLKRAGSARPPKGDFSARAREVAAKPYVDLVGKVCHG